MLKRTTIFADDELLYEIKEISKEESKSVAQVVREALSNYIKQKVKKKKISFVGIGNSGRSDIAEKSEELLWKKDTK